MTLDIHKMTVHFKQDPRPRLQGLHDNLIGNILKKVSLVQWRIKGNSTYPLELLVRQANTILYAHFVAHTTLLAQDGDALDFDTLLDDAGRMAANRDGGSLHTSPGTDPAAPANDGVQNASVVADLSIFENDRVLHTGTGPNDDARTDGDVGPELGRGVNFSGRVDVDWGNDGGGG